MIILTQLLDNVYIRLVRYIYTAMESNVNVWVVNTKVKVNNEGFISLNKFEANETYVSKEVY